MTSVPSLPADSRLNGSPGCIGEMFKDALLGGIGAEDADVIWKWDAGARSYAEAYLVAGRANLMTENGGTIRRAPSQR